MRLSTLDRSPSCLALQGRVGTEAGAVRCRAAQDASTLAGVYQRIVKMGSPTPPAGEETEPLKGGRTRPSLLGGVSDRVDCSETIQTRADSGRPVKWRRPRAGGCESVGRSDSPAMRRTIAARATAGLDATAAGCSPRPAIRIPDPDERTRIETIPTKAAPRGDGASGAIVVSRIQPRA